MPNLVHRTEEALLGALIYDPSLAADVPYLLPRHFSNPDHQAIFAAFLDARAIEPTATGAVLADQIIVQADQSNINDARITGMALASPDLSSVAVYGRMIQEAGLYRDLAAHADRLAQEAGPLRGIDPELDHLDALSGALNAHNARYNADFEATLTYEVDVQAPLDDLQALREEEMLADLIQNPHVLDEVAAWLDPEIFTSPARRDIYEAIVAVDRSGEPVEELTVAWEAARSRSSDITMTDSDTRTADAPTPPGYLARLSAMAVETGVAVELGRDLLADRTRVEFATSAADHTTVTGGVSPASAHRDVHHHRTFTQESAPLLAPPPEPTLGLDGPELRQ